MYSVDFAPIEVLQQQGRWQEAAQEMVKAAQHVQAGGADLVVLCTNTMHKVADEMQRQIDIPLLHIADATANEIVAQDIHCVGLLGTRFTMEESFYKGRLVERHGLEVLIPGEQTREIVHRIIYDELCLGQVKAASRKQYAAIIADLVQAGAQGVILGCTEIGLLVKPEDSPVPLFDTTEIHAAAAVEYALAT
jgi:aspartate racemase